MRTERCAPEQDGEQRRIIHTVYEPGSFTPLLRLQKTVTLLSAVGCARAHPTAESRVTEEDDSNPIAQALQQVGNPEAQTRLRRYLQGPEGTAALVQQNLVALGAMGTEAAGFITEQLQELKRLKQERDDKDTQGVELSFYLCDHLGTPNALVGRQGNIIWAATMDAWGNVFEEFNPLGLEQPIRLTGQNHDLQTGLPYNRHRYYGPSI